MLYIPGDLVWIFTPVRKVGLSEKLLKRYFGPYRVLRQLSDVTYEVEDCDLTSRRRKRKDTVHVLRMKPYYDPNVQNENIPDDTNPDSLDQNPKEKTVRKNPIALQNQASGKSMDAGPMTRSRTRKTNPDSIPARRWFP